MLIHTPDFSRFRDARRESEQTIADELFDPVVSLIRANDDALRITNDSRLSLAQPIMPFGGIKDSGYGRKHGGFGMREFVNAQAILVMAA